MLAPYMANQNYTGQNILHSLPSEKMFEEIEARKRGRAGKITPDIAAEIIELLEDGKTLQYVSDKLGISRPTINAACHANPDFLNVINRARQVGADAIFEDALNCIDQVDVKPDIDHKYTGNLLRKAALRSGAKIRIAESYNPAKYSQKTMSFNANVSVQADADVIADLFTR